MNCKLLAIWISVMFILWIMLFYIVNNDKINKLKEHFTEHFTSTSLNSYIDVDILNYQLNELDKNYNSIDELQGNIDTTTRKINLLTIQTNELNKIAYIFKYITIISISLLILMICIFVLNFDHIKGPSARARGKMKSFFNKVKNKKIKV